MMDFAIHLEARNPARNIWRAYSITGGQDLFGDWVVVLSYGRIGAKGQTKTVMLPDEEATRRYVRQCLKKRENAPKRIGIGYTMIQATGVWKAFIEQGRQEDQQHPALNTIE
ncbi:MAG: WGR domain-containing protein [Methylococcales bacterium]|nr:WGR domain-containing protein [Methylococcales bacterium]